MAPSSSSSSSSSSPLTVSSLLLSCPSSAWPTSVVVYGPPQSGKSKAVAEVVQSTDLDGRGCLVSCVPGAVHARLVLQEIAERLFGEQTSPVSTLSDLIRVMRANWDGGDGGLVIGLNEAERLRDMDANLLPGFLRLAELSGLTVCVVLVSSTPWNKFAVSSGLPHPVAVVMRRWTKVEMIAHIAEKIRLRQEAEDEDRDFEWTHQFFERFVDLVVNVFYCACRSVPVLEYYCSKHFPSYREPVLSGDVDQNNVRALYKAVEKDLKASLATLHLQETASQQLMAARDKEAADADLASTADAASVGQNKRLTVELPFHSKFLLLASYLASYNPVKSDKRFFVKHHGRQRKTKASIKSKERAEVTQLTGPKAFPLNRMMAIFYSIVGEQVTPSASIQSQISSLVSLQFLMAVGTETLDEPKFKCNVGLDFAAQMAKQVNFELHKYLYDFT